MDGFGQRDEPVFVQHQLLQLATPGTTDKQFEQRAATKYEYQPKHKCKKCLCLPAESLWDELQVIVSSHEFCEAGQFADAGRNPVKVQLVGVDVQLLQFGQLTDCRLEGAKI